MIAVSIKALISIALTLPLFALVISTASADTVQPAPSLDDLRLAAFNHPQDPGAHDALGVALGTAGQWFQACLELKTAIWLAPTVNQYKLDLATTTEESGDLKSAETELEKIVKASPTDGAAQLDLAELYVDSGRDNDALKEFASAEQLLPNSFGLHYEYGQALLANKKITSAVAEFQSCSQLQPANTDCLTALAAAQDELGHPSDAIATLTNAIGLQTMSPDADAQAHMELADLYLQSGKTDKAVAELKASLTLTPQDPHIHNALGAAYFASGDTKDALAEWRTALKSGDQEAQTTAQQWMTSLGKN